MYHKQLSIKELTWGKNIALCYLRKAISKRSTVGIAKAGCI